MGTSSTPEDGGENDDLLLQTSGTVLQMAEIARINEVNKEARVLYSHPGIQLRQIPRPCKARTPDLVPTQGGTGQPSSAPSRLSSS